MYSRCIPCQTDFQNNKPKKVYELKRTPLKRPTEIKISQVSKTNANTPAKFTSEIKAKILIRDKHCLFCTCAIQDYHHIYYGWQAEYGPIRNNVDRGVWLCRRHHEMIHHFTDWSSQRIRQQCIDYVNNYYNDKK